MEQRRLGRSGLRVSRIGLGTLTWGRDTDEHEAADQLTAFVEAGGTLLDSAGSYGDGASERLIGALLRDVLPREDVVLCTKGGVTGQGTSQRVACDRGSLLTSLDASLARLRTDYVDLWLVQGWDVHVPVEETLSALEIAAASGRARYVGVSNYNGWQLAQAATLASALPCGSRLVANEVEYSLVARGIEADVAPAAQAVGAGLLAWSPLGRGVLTGKYRTGTPADSRAASPHFAGYVQPYLDGGPRRVVEAVATAAEGLGREPVEVALAWVRDRPGVAAAIVGARTAAQLRGSLAAEDVELPAQIRQALDDVSVDCRASNS
jgi:aryl-alcohol dehydrogenase-like predicted oxidoreductase